MEDHPQHAACVDKLIAACESGSITDVEESLAAGADPRIDCSERSREYNGALRRAARNGHVAIVKRLLADARVTPDATAFSDAAKAGHVTVLQVLLEDDRLMPSTKDEAVWLAAGSGHAAVVDLLLTAGRADPAAGENRAIITAAARGHVSVVTLLLKHPRVDPHADGDSALVLAAREGHVEVVRELIEDERWPTFSRCNAADRAAANGHEDIVKLLEEMAAVRFHRACKRGDAGTVVAMLPSSVGPAIQDGLAAAVWYGRTAVIEVLLADPRVDLAAKAAFHVRSAISARQAPCLARLLQDARIGAARTENFGLTRAAECGNAEALSMLLAFPGVDPAWENNEAIRRALRVRVTDGGNPEVIELLLADPRVDPTIHMRVEADEEEVRDPFEYWVTTETVLPSSKVFFESDIGSALLSARDCYWARVAALPCFLRHCLARHLPLADAVQLRHVHGGAAGVLAAAAAAAWRRRRAAVSARFVKIGKAPLPA